MTVLITGGSGTLGQALLEKYPNAFAPTHKEFDFTNRSVVFDYLEKYPIDIIIHSGALIGARTCDNNRAKAWKTNIEGTRHLVDAIIHSKKKIQFCYISTTGVFDGRTGMYDEYSIPCPVNFYCLTKLIGEHEVRKLSKYLIIRTTFAAKKKWPYSSEFTDRFGTYLFAEDVAKGIKDVQKSNLQGIVHVTGNKKMSTFEFAKITTPNIKPKTMNDYSGPELMLDMSLDTKRWKKYVISK